MGLVVWVTSIVDVVVTCLVMSKFHHVYCALEETRAIPGLKCWGWLMYPVVQWAPPL